MFFLKEFLFRQIRDILVKFGKRSLQEVIGCTELFKFFFDSENYKVGLLDFSFILKNVLIIRLNIEILGGSVKQIFDLDKRFVSFRYRDFKEIKGGGGEGNNVIWMKGWKEEGGGLIKQIFQVGEAVR